jgi:GntR family transcriptional regulator
MKPGRIERNSPLPLYHQLKQVLFDQIGSGQWKPGELIPGEQELQDMYGLSRTTVRQALRELELEGKVIRYRGRGTFVSTPKIIHSPEPARSLTSSLLRRQITPRWRIISNGDVPVAGDVAERLGCAAGTRVYQLVRLRLANDEPIGIHVAHVSPDYVKYVDENRFSSGESMDYLHAGRVLEGSRAERVLEAVPATDQHAQHLGVEPGAAMLRIIRQLTDVEGHPVEDLCAVYRGDRFEYHVSSVGSVAP